MGDGSGLWGRTLCLEGEDSNPRHYLDEAKGRKERQPTKHVCARIVCCLPSPACSCLRRVSPSPRPARTRAQELMSYPEAFHYEFRLFGGEVLKLHPDGSFSVDGNSCNGDLYTGAQRCL